MIPIESVRPAAFRDVEAYPPELVRRTMDGVRAAVTYHSEWQDGFGARGWKLDVGIGDPEIIASTRETGGRIPTSVLIHDLLDHLLSGFAPSGHRAEAMALAQLELRTGSDVRSDYEQMVREDLLVGRFLGEAAREFLGASLVGELPEEIDDARELVSVLCARWGETELVDRLIGRFYQLGREGMEHASASWHRLGLRPESRAAVGMALQRALIAADAYVERSGLSSVRAGFLVGAEECVIDLQGDGMPSFGSPVGSEAG